MLTADKPPAAAVPDPAVDPLSTPETAMREALRRAGGIPEVARRMGVRRQAIYQWPRVPADRAAALSEMSGVPAWRLRPDIFPAPAPEAAQ